MPRGLNHIQEFAATATSITTQFASPAQKTPFRRRDVRQESRSFARENQRLQRNPNAIRLFFC